MDTKVLLPTLMLVGLALAAPTVTAIENCEDSIATLLDAVEQTVPDSEELRNLADEVTANCGASLAGTDGSNTLCYPHELVPLACATAHSEPARKAETCRTVPVTGDYVCDYKVTAWGSGSGLLAAGDVYTWAFDGSQGCHWITAGGSCTTAAIHYDLPAVVNGSDGCAYTETVTVTTFFVAQTHAIGNCYS